MVFGYYNFLKRSIKAVSLNFVVLLYMIKALSEISCVVNLHVDLHDQ